MAALRNALATLLLVVLYAGALDAEDSHPTLYLLYQDGRYAMVGPSGTISERDLSSEGITSVDGAAQDPLGESLVLATSSLSYGEEGQPPTKLVVLDDSSGGHLKARGSIEPPTEQDRLVGFRWLGRPGGLLVTWHNVNSDKYITYIFDSATLQKRKEVEGFIATRFTCLSDLDSKVYTPIAGQPREIQALDLSASSWISQPYELVGGENYFSKGVAASDNCLILVIRYNTPPTDTEIDGHVYIYSMDRKQVTTERPLSVRGDFHILKSQGVFVLDEKRTDQITAEKGENLGIKSEKLGKLRVYDLATGKELAIIEVPPRGNFAGWSLDDKLGFYVSGQELTIVDFANRRIIDRLGLDLLEVKFIFASNSNANPRTPE